MGADLGPGSDQFPDHQPVLQADASQDHVAATGNRR